MNSLDGFYRLTDGRLTATYEHIETGATCIISVRTIERAEHEDKRLRNDGYAPVLLKLIEQE